MCMTWEHHHRRIGRKGKAVFRHGERESHGFCEIRRFRRVIVQFAGNAAHQDARIGDIGCVA